jgi:tRNA (mo5U34)-methyltransferase
VLQLRQLRRLQVSCRYASLRAIIERRPDFAWLEPLVRESERTIDAGNHGDLPGWKAALAALPRAEQSLDGTVAAPALGRPVQDPESLRSILMRLHPWRKGPLELGGVMIDSEWRSDMKWARIAGALDLRGHTVLDVGCGNGYYGWRMLGAGADCVIGIDPTLVYVMQWLACRHFSGDCNHFVLPLGLERLPGSAGGFDSVFSLGVLYHRRDPVEHLERLAALARPGGAVVVETLVLEGDDSDVLVPGGRYARMRNVRAVPALAVLRDWMRRAGLDGITVLDVSRTTVSEQRRTDWMRFESLEACLAPGDQGRTVEGHPAPVRAAVLARSSARPAGNRGRKFR